MEQPYKKYLRFDKRILIVGFGGIGQATLPVLLRHIDVKPSQLKIISKKADGEPIAKEYGVTFVQQALTKQNYRELLTKELSRGDFLLNLSVDVASVDLMKLCRELGVMYLDTCIEPWEGVYTDETLPAALRSNYAFREAALALKKEPSLDNPTTIVTHGANPGLVSHFVKQALINMAKDTNVFMSVPKTQEEWAELARSLAIKVIHIAERDTQVSSNPKRPNEFVNTWSVDGFVAEGSQPAELGWGSHEKHWPKDACHHEFGCKSAIYLNRPGASTRVRTWTPKAGQFHGFLITHGESISISHHFTLETEEGILYRPTVHYAYHPCEDAVLSIHELAGREWRLQQNHRMLFQEIIDGVDELGVLLMGNPKGAYWFGSELSIHEARKLVPHNNATSLQVAISVVAGMLWAMENPNRGVIEPDDIDFEYILRIAIPYLGKVHGAYTDWNPIKERERLFPETIDRSDPWQFVNMRVH